MKYALLFSVIILAVGCKENSIESLCLDCIWNKSSNAVRIDFRGGLSGGVRYEILPDGSSVSYPAQDTYSAEQMTEATLDFLKRIKPTSESYDTQLCVADRISTTLTVISTSGSEVTYLTNDIYACTDGMDQTKDYVDYFEMKLLIRMLEGEDISRAWLPSSNRLTIAVKEQGASSFDTILDLRRDEMSYDFTRYIRFLSSTSSNLLECPEGFRHYKVTITDKNGDKMEYLDDSSAGCAAPGVEVVSLKLSDISRLLNLMDVFDHGFGIIFD